MQNAFENLTVDSGNNNPGAIGLEFFANNSGAVRNVTIRSGDTEKRGYAGLSMVAPNNSCTLVQHVTITGFDYGIRMTHPCLNTVFEHIALTDQKRCGFELQHHNAAIRGLTSTNKVPAIRISGTATLALIDSTLVASDPATEAPAIDFLAGDLFANHVQCSGYATTLQRPDTAPLKTRRLTDYCSRSGPSPFGAKPETLNLPVEEPPHVAWEQDMNQWASVHDFGAVGDGFTDDTAAIQRAMNSGKSVIHFEAKQYLINHAIEIPSSVKCINFMYGDLVTGPQLRKNPPRGVFKVVGDSSDPLLIEDLFTFELFFGDAYLINHASTRTLYFSDVHVQIAALYCNTVPGGKVFFENIASAVMSVKYRIERKINCSFFGQQVWARQFNIERGSPECLNDGSSLWVLGFKTEQDGKSFETINGGKTEILGGIFNNTRTAQSEPDIVISNASLSVFGCTTGPGKNKPEINARPLVRETQNGITKETPLIDFPIRNPDANLITVPLYRSAH